MDASDNTSSVNITVEVQGMLVIILPIVHHYITKISIKVYLYSFGQ